MKELAIGTRDAALALIMPLIILGGIFLGIFTPTEAAAVAAAYALLVGIFIYRKMNFREIPRILFNAAYSSGTLFFVIACASILGWAFAMMQVPQQVLILFTGPKGLSMAHSSHHECLPALDGDVAGCDSEHSFIRSHHGPPGILHRDRSDSFFHGLRHERQFRKYHSSCRDCPLCNPGRRKSEDGAVGQGAPPFPHDQNRDYFPDHVRSLHQFVVAAALRLCDRRPFPSAEILSRTFLRGTLTIFNGFYDLGITGAAAGVSPDIIPNFPLGRLGSRSARIFPSGSFRECRTRTARPRFAGRIPARGSNTPSGLVIPSMVVISRPARLIAKVRHARSGFPSTSTVQAPHSPMPHPYLAPVSPKRSRNTLRSSSLGATSNSWICPFTMSSMGFFRRVLQKKFGFRGSISRRTC